jgi:hypothetical protein
MDTDYAMENDGKDGFETRLYIDHITWKTMVKTGFKPVSTIIQRITYMPWH